MLKSPCNIKLQRLDSNYLVQMARLELARLAPLPPQDSVSTNSTTSACQVYHSETGTSDCGAPLGFSTCCCGVGTMSTTLVALVFWVAT